MPSSQHDSPFTEELWRLKPTLAWTQLNLSLKCNKATLLDANAPKEPGNIRFVCISDTHGDVDGLSGMNIPDGDVLIHAGDLTRFGEGSSVYQLNELFAKLPHTHKIVIAGNHDISLDPNAPNSHVLRLGRACASLLGKKPFSSMRHSLVEDDRLTRSMLTNCVYLEDSGIELYGIKIWGSPWTPTSHTWGFKRDRGPDIAAKWDLIPDDTDVLVTHSPPLGHGDVRFDGKHIGCLDLLKAVNERVRPAYHVFGHVHQGYGATTDGATTFVNAAVCTGLYHARRPPLVFDLPARPGPAAAAAE